MFHTLSRVEIIENSAIYLRNEQARVLTFREYDKHFYHFSFVHLVDFLTQDHSKKNGGFGTDKTRFRLHICLKTNLKDLFSCKSRSLHQFEKERLVALCLSLGVGQGCRKGKRGVVA